MSFFNKSTEGEKITADLERGYFATWTCDANGKVVTDAIVDYAVSGRDNTLIGRAYTAWDWTGLNTVVVRELGVEVGPVPPDGVFRKKVGLNVVIKARLDTAPPGPKRDVPNSGYGMLSAHPELRAEFVMEAPPNTFYGAAMKIPGNPGATLGHVSSDMLAGGGLPYTVDGKTVGVPFFTDIERPPFIVTQTPDGVTRVYVRDYGHREEYPGQQGTGCFVIFQTQNDKGEWVDSAQLNGGMISRKAGKEQGDIDILWPVNGDSRCGVAGVGDMREFGGGPPAWLPVIDGQLDSGATNHRWIDLYFSGALDCISTMQTIGGVKTECVPVRTQNGVAYLPLKKADH